MNYRAERAAALVDLMAVPDPPDLPRRSHQVTHQGKADRFRQLPYLSSVYVQQRLQDRDDRRAA